MLFTYMSNALLGLP